MDTSPALTFLGATGTVTGSKYLIEANGLKVLIDCGLFQGPKALRQRNWKPLPIDADSIDAVILTHAHLDHSGYLPVLYQQGFRGPVFCTSGTAALARILLPDSGYLQEEGARYAGKKQYTQHQQPKPLYTKAIAEASLDVLEAVKFNEPVPIGKDFTAIFHPAGHILGAAWVQLTINGQRTTLSGDVGRPNDPVMNPPESLNATDYLVVESTYGNRRHDQSSPLDLLRDVVNRTVVRNGILLIPAFAIGRAQTVLHLLSVLREQNQIPKVPIFLNSPMAINATKIFCAHSDEHRLTNEACQQMCDAASYVNSADESRALNRRRDPMIIISASGMASGGRILHHFKTWLGNARNTVLFTGYQAAGTRGAEMLGGAQKVTIHGQSYDVNAEITEISSLSAHADCDELIGWLDPLKKAAPKNVFITHGEPEAASALKERLETDLGIGAQIPADHQRILLK